MATCDILDLCPRAEADPNDPDFVLFWDTEDPATVVRMRRASWGTFLTDVKSGEYDNV